MASYNYCTCPDCFEITISDENDVGNKCAECEEAGCNGGECQAPNAYGGTEAQ